MQNYSYLVLSRNVGQSVELQIPNANGTHTTIYIDINKLKGKQIHLGIDAPREVQIMRPESM